MTIQHIQQLRSIINKSLDDLETLCSEKRVVVPSLDDAYSADYEEAFSGSGATQAINFAVSACYQLIATFKHPFATLADASSAYHLSSCLRVAEKFNIPEVLREAGSAGCHVTDIAAKTGLEATKIGRILRVLATHHIFREVAVDTFANNRISSFFDTGKSSKALFMQPGGKYQGTSGAAGYIGTFTDDICKASSYLLENLEDKEAGPKFAADQAALQKAFSTNKTYFAWLEEKGNEYRFNRYGACIRATSLWDPPEAVLQGFDWASLGEGSLVVDVGGGTGAPAMILARRFPHIRLTIQDREPVVVQGKQYWREVFPEALESGRVSFQVHDFFDAQPEDKATIFLVRTICHDWPDELAVKILANLRQAAGNATKLVLGDFIIPYACPSSVPTPMVSGAEASKVPEPLLTNLGKANANTYWIDMTMQVLLNGQERTLAHHIDIASRAGWRIIEAHYVKDSLFGYLTAEPIS